jgi:hypothetical protein
VPERRLDERHLQGLDHRRIRGPRREPGQVPDRVPGVWPLEHLAAGGRPFEDGEARGLGGLAQAEARHVGDPPVGIVVRHVTLSGRGTATAGAAGPPPPCPAE